MFRSSVESARASLPCNEDPPVQKHSRKGNLSLDLNSQYTISNLQKELEEFNRFRRSEKKSRSKSRHLRRDNRELEKALQESQEEVKNLQHKYFEVEKELLAAKKENIKLANKGEPGEMCDGLIDSIRKALNAPRNQDILGKITALKKEATGVGRDKELVRKVRGLVAQLTRQKEAEISVKTIWKWIRYLAEDYAKVKSKLTLA